MEALKPPDVIYLQPQPEKYKEFGTYCQSRVNEFDIGYVTEETAVRAQVNSHKQGYREGWEAAGLAIAKELAKL